MDIEELKARAVTIRDEEASAANTAYRVGSLFFDMLDAEAINVIGIPGPQGDIGPAGPMGPKGPKGDKGDKGDTGSQGIQGIPGIVGPEGPEGPTGPQGLTGPEGPAGNNGQEVEFRTHEEYIQWRYIGDTWNNLVTLAEISGREIELRIDNNILQWKYTDEIEWVTLISLWELLGITRRVIVIDDNYSILPQDKSVLAGNVTKNIELSLPEISTVGLQEITVRVNKDSTFAVTILISGTDSIDFDSSTVAGITTTTVGSWITFTSDEDSGNWYVTAGGEGWDEIT